MTEEEVVYPRVVLKVIDGEEPGGEVLVEAVEIGLDADGETIELTRDQGQFYELSSTELGEIIEEAKDHAAKLGIPYDNLINEEDEPEVTDDEL